MSKAKKIGFKGIFKNCINYKKGDYCDFWNVPLTLVKEMNPVTKLKEIKSIGRCHTCLEYKKVT